ncbi:branched chain amino acid aminotransferase [Luteitalea sp. TBR-22]|uniref:aminotransferase class IV n=1 Tax=Luteitalea sp. TBR-22 TaxID=2802971 RepID=UPI001AF290AA|nr:aminotransferase class IV [Luteitalea sp. TBR-22]BCS33317.1 branched chain amino acid aminotransferase [Luteitalea sp. TBR-22]
MPVAVNIDGRLYGRDEARVSVFDHGFLFGEGVYEVLRTYGGRPFLYPEHMRRLRASAARIALECPLDDDQLLVRIRETMTAAALEGEAYVRILLTRGVGEIVYDPQACPTPTIVIIVKPHVDPAPDALAQGVRIALASVVRNHPGSVDPAIKSNNLLNNALAMQQALREGAAEALMENHRGELCECAQSNIFFVRGGVLLTPPVDAGLLVGVTRQFVLEVAAAVGVPAEERTLRREDLATVDEAFLTSTTKAIVPVVQVGDARIGPGVPGPITRRLMAGFEAAIPARLA